ncbi:hypothetical protein M5K25_010005 [Dendrobium thyrsiflorum]|uniref:Uncharacterized protein n=1 Tax=Dendrobium thyrsiflorum TaxID=117978 RepID=A0ABD0V761_DENTH
MTPESRIDEEIASHLLWGTLLGPIFIVHDVGHCEGAQQCAVRLSLQADLEECESPSLSVSIVRCKLLPVSFSGYCWPSRSQRVACDLSRLARIACTLSPSVTSYLQQSIVMHTVPLCHSTLPCSQLQVFPIAPFDLQFRLQEIIARRWGIR